MSQIVPESIRRALIKPSRFTLFSTEEEVGLWPKDDANTPLIQEKRKILRPMLKKAGITDEIIDKMNGKELLACDLLFTNPKTSAILQKPEGAIPASLYDAEHILEFRLKIDTPAHIRRARAVFNKAVDEGIKTYEQKLGDARCCHVNFSAWERQGDNYTNVLDPKQQAFVSKGSNVAKQVIDKIRATDGFILRGNSKKSGQNIVLGVSRGDEIRHAGHGDESRLEVRLREDDNVDTLIDLIDTQSMSALRQKYLLPAKDVDIVQRAFFEAPDKSLKVTAHALNGSVIAQDGRVIPNRSYIQQKANDLATELGLMTLDTYKNHAMQHFMPWYGEAIAKILEHSVVTGEGEGQKIDFPKLRVNDELPPYPTHYENCAMDLVAGIRTVQDESGKPVVEISRALLDSEGPQRYKCGIAGVEEVNKRLSKITVKGKSQALVYHPAQSPADVWSVSGSLGAPVVRVDISRVPPEQREAFIVNLYHDAFHVPKRNDYQIYLDGNQIRDEVIKEVASRINKQGGLFADIAASRVIEFRGMQSLYLLHQNHIPMSAVVAFHPQPDKAWPIASPVPKLIFDPAFAPTRKKLAAFISLEDCRCVTVGTPLGKIAFVAPRDKVDAAVLEELKRDEHIKKLGIIISDTPDGCKVTLPSGVFEGIMNAVDSVLRGLSPEKQLMIFPGPATKPAIPEGSAGNRISKTTGGGRQAGQGQ